MHMFNFDMEFLKEDIKHFKKFGLDGTAFEKVNKINSTYKVTIGDLN